MKARDQRVFRRIFRRMITLMSLTIFVAAIAAGIGGKEVGIVVVLLCLWLLPMPFRRDHRTLVRETSLGSESNQYAADMLSNLLFIAVGVGHGSSGAVASPQAAI
jgi:hypothetical protein